MYAVYVSDAMFISSLNEKPTLRFEYKDIESATVFASEVIEHGKMCVIVKEEPFRELKVGV